MLHRKLCMTRCPLCKQVYITLYTKLVQFSIEFNCTVAQTTRLSLDHSFRIFSKKTDAMKQKYVQGGTKVQSSVNLLAIHLGRSDHDYNKD